MSAKGYNLDRESVSALTELARRYLRAPRKASGQGRPTISPDEILYAMITTTATALNGGIRYTYAIQLGHWDLSTNASTGGTWINDSGAGTYIAFSSAEDMNTFANGTGTIGTGNTGVAQADGEIGSSSCKLLPLPSGCYVLVKLRGYAADVPVFTILNAMNSAGP